MNPIFYPKATVDITWTMKSAHERRYWLHFKDGRNVEGPFRTREDAKAHALNLGETVVD